MIELNKKLVVLMIFLVVGSLLLNACEQEKGKKLEKQNNEIVSPDEKSASVPGGSIKDAIDYQQAQRQE